MQKQKQIIWLIYKTNTRKKERKKEKEAEIEIKTSKIEINKIKKVL